jgi:hypothetical protein
MKRRDRTSNVFEIFLRLSEDEAIAISFDLIGRDYPKGGRVRNAVILK